jgi:hypothetical protein
MAVHAMHVLDHSLKPQGMIQHRGRPGAEGWGARPGGRREGFLLLSKQTFKIQNSSLFFRFHILKTRHFLALPFYLKDS